MMTKKERIAALSRGEKADRVPISLWVHYHLQDRNPARLAAATAALHGNYDTDLIKLTPSGLYGVQDWGAAIRYSRSDWEAPEMNESVIRSADDWAQLPKLDARNGALGRELELIRATRSAVGGDVPILQTIFSPLTTAWKLLGNAASPELIQRYMGESGDKLHAALRTIASVTSDYAEACLDAGANGFFFATQLANFELLASESQYSEFGVPYDRQVLESARGRTEVNVLHICRTKLMFRLLSDYPVEIVNWNNFESGTSLAEARKLTKKALSGGLDNRRMHLISPAEVTAMAKSAIAEAGEGGFLLAPTCVIDARTPHENLVAARAAAS